MRASAIIVAAGSGSRLGSETPKAFIQVGAQSLLHYSLRTIAQLPAIFEAVVTVPAGMESAARAEAKRAGLEIPLKITPGGIERQDSVRIALALTSAESEWVIIHDAARPFATSVPFRTKRILDRAARGRCRRRVCLVRGRACPRQAVVRRSLLPDRLLSFPMREGTKVPEVEEEVTAGRLPPGHQRNRQVPSSEISRS